MDRASFLKAKVNLLLPTLTWPVRNLGSDHPVGLLSIEPLSSSTVFTFEDLFSQFSDPHRGIRPKIVPAHIKFNKTALYGGR